MVFLKTFLTPGELLSYEGGFAFGIIITTAVAAFYRLFFEVLGFRDGYFFIGIVFWTVASFAWFNYGLRCIEKDIKKGGRS